MNNAIVFGGFAALVAFIIFGMATDAFGSTGGNLSAQQIAQYAKNAGFSGSDLATAVAIALAESSGNPSAVGDLNLGVSSGLWQINLRAHPEFAGWNLFDPQQNANAAYSVYAAAGNSFSPWSTYKSGAYASNLPAAQGAAANV